MAVPISRRNMPSVFSLLLPRADLFGFFLFDSREDQRQVEAFVRAEFRWFDELAKSARMYFFMFIADKDDVSGSDDPSGSDNPSLEVASRFDIRPNQLPGIVLFTAKDGQPNEGVFLPLKVELFQDGARHARDAIADLFALVQEAHKGATSPTDVLANIRRGVSSMNRDGRIRPILVWLRGTIVELARIPREVLIAAATGYGTALGKGLAP